MKNGKKTYTSESCPWGRFPKGCKRPGVLLSKVVYGLFALTIYGHNWSVPNPRARLPCAVMLVSTKEPGKDGEDRFANFNCFLCLSKFANWPWTVLGRTGRHFWVAKKWFICESFGENLTLNRFHFVTSFPEHLANRYSAEHFTVETVVNISKML